MPTIRRGDVDLYFSDSGSGPAALLHTGGGGDGRMWEQAGYVSGLDAYRLLVLDHRGHGRSGKPASLESHRMGEYVADVIAVLDAAGAERAAFVGYSGGASVAFAAAAMHPERIAAVVGIGTVGGPDEAKVDQLPFVAHVRQVGMAHTMQEYSDQEPEPAPTWLLQNLASTNTEMFALLLEGWSSDPGNWVYLPHIQAPTLLVCGDLEEDDSMAEPHLVEAARTLQIGEAVVLPGIAHLQVFWRSDLTLPVVQNFLRRRYPPA